MASNGRVPPSPSTTASVPWVSRYSADIISSSMVAARPRFSSTGLPSSATRRRSSKFCMSRAPTSTTSTSSANTASGSSEATSATIGRPTVSPASRSSSRPATPSSASVPGAVGGLKTPPRNAAAPDSASAAASSWICCRDSIVAGPAMTVSRPPPMRTRPASTTLACRRSSREAGLYGWVIGTTLATPGSCSTSCGSSSAWPMAARPGRRHRRSL